MYLYVLNYYYTIYTCCAPLSWKDTINNSCIDLVRMLILYTHTRMHECTSAHTHTVCKMNSSQLLRRKAKYFGKRPKRTPWVRATFQLKSVISATTFSSVYFDHWLAEYYWKMCDHWQGSHPKILLIHA